MTYNLGLYITLNLDYQTIKIKIADYIIFKIQIVSITNLYILVENKYIQIELINIYYLLTNLISFRILKEKKYEFCIVNNLL